MQQRFDGPTLEAALEAAVRALGPDLQVVDARRVRTGGVAGFFSREQYEVIAGPGPARGPAPGAGAAAGAPAPGTVATQSAPAARGGEADEAALQASIDRTIQALIEDVERRGDLAGPPRFADLLAGAAAQVGRRGEAVAPVIDAEPEPVDAEVAEDGTEGAVRAPVREEVPEPGPAVHPPTAAPLAVEGRGTARRAARPQQAPARQPDDCDESAPAIDDAPRWSRQALRRLGVPAAIVNRLPSQRITSDALWIAALTDAIAAEVPPPAEPGPGAELCVSGYGAEAAVKILQAAVQGFTPGTLWLDGEVLPATPVVLALAVRGCLPR